MRIKPRTSLYAACRAALLLLLLLCCANVEAREELPRGVVVERVACRDDAGQSYALYLPSNYTPQKKWPVLYLFDPEARGVLPVELFRAAAEKYGYILVGSHNSRNGPDLPLQKILTALWNDTHARLSIDEKRVYTGGFSGGARVAVRVAAALDGQVAGVIACGAGFPTDIRPASAISFVLYGTIGTDDFNFREMKQLAEALTVAGIPQHVNIFDGWHSWPPAPAREQALAWFEVQARRRGTGAATEAFIDEQLKRAVDEAHAHERAGELLRAYLTMQSIIADFRGLRDVGEFEKRLVELKESKEVRAALRAEKEQLAREQSLERQLDLLFEQSKIPESGFEAVNNLRAVLSNLAKQAAQEKDSQERRVARRVLSGFNSRILEEASSLLLRKNYAAASAHLEKATAMQPANASLHVALARTYVMQGNKRKALGALKRAAESGLNDPKILQRDGDFELLRGEPEFQKILEGLKGVAAPRSN